MSTPPSPRIRHGDTVTLHVGSVADATRALASLGRAGLRAD
jgi:hypothetical protein